MRRIIYLFLLAAALIACQQAPDNDDLIVPTELPPAPELTLDPSPTAEIQPDLEATATQVAGEVAETAAEQDIAPQPSPTTAPEPTLTPEPSAPEPTPVPTETPLPTADSYEIVVLSPQPDETIFIANQYTFQGTINPLPLEPLNVTLQAEGDPNGIFYGAAEVNAETGEWSLAVDIHPGRTGLSTLTIGVGSTTTETPVNLAFRPGQEGVFVVLNAPNQGDLAVIGQMMLLSGEARNVPNGRLDLQINNCNESPTPLSEISIEIGDGPWNAFMVIPPGLEPQIGCLIISASELDNVDPSIVWMGSVSLNLVAQESEEANLIQVGEAAALEFEAGRTTELYGIAINAPENLITLTLFDGSGTALSTATATTGRFGYWESALALPDEADLTAARLVVSYGSGEEEVVWERMVNNQ